MFDLGTLLEHLAQELPAYEERTCITSEEA